MYTRYTFLNRGGPKAGTVCQICATSVSQNAEVANLSRRKNTCPGQAQQRVGANQSCRTNTNVNIACARAMSDCSMWQNSPAETGRESSPLPWFKTLQDRGPLINPPMFQTVRPPLVAAILSTSIGKTEATPLPARVRDTWKGSISYRQWVACFILFMDIFVRC